MDKPAPQCCRVPHGARKLPTLRPVNSPKAIGMADNNLVEQGQGAIDAVAAGRMALGRSAQVLAGLMNLVNIIEATNTQTQPNTILVFLSLLRSACSSHCWSRGAR